MKKKFLIIFVVAVFIFVLGVIYFNTVILPTKLKALIVQGLQEITQKKVKIESLEFHIFRGMVLKNLVLYDDKETFLELREGSCNFLILPLFKKIIVIPSVRLKSLSIFLERRADNTLNILDLFMQPKTITALTQNKKFSIFVYKITVVDSRINFRDKTFEPEFSRVADNLSLILRLSLPAGVKFNLKSEIAAALRTKVFAEGEYRIPQRKLQAQVSIKDLAVQEYAVYYRNSGISFTKGAIDALLNIKLQEDILFCDLETKNKDLGLSKDKVGAQLNSDIKAHLQYGLKDKQLKFSGSTDIARLDISGLGFIDKVDNIKGKLNFDNSGLSAEKLSAQILDVPIEARFRLTDFKEPFLNLEIISSMLNLDYIKSILKDRFKFVLPVDLQGKGRLSLKIESKLPFTRPLPLNVYLDIFNAILKLKELKSPFEDISGRLEFSRQQLKWPKLNFRYLGISYKTEGVLTNFNAPVVQLKLSSDELYLESELGIKEKLISFSKVDGRYLNSDFSIKGNIDATEPSSLQADFIALININLQDLSVPFKNFKDKLEQLKPSGMVQAKINFSGNINDIKSCFIQADLSSPALSIYGLRSESFSLNYHQESSLVDIPLIHFSLYDGALEAAAGMNLVSENLPYWLSVNIKDVKLEKLKLDTTAKDKDLAGTLQGEVKINGFYKEPFGFTGAGRIFISEGKLWELNLLRGLGKLLFAKNFATIAFKEGGCDFLIQDKSIFTNNLKLKGEFVDLDGSLKIGFDSSIDAALNVHVNDEMVPLSGTFKDVTTAIVGGAGRFGVIKITGTLKEPKYKFQSAVVDLIKSLKDAFFGK